jgi:hypothetical protein
MCDYDQPDPPWIVYPDAEPFWGGWRQGHSEAWLLGEWLPFWRGLTSDERRSFLERWPPPTKDWEVYLNDLWLR